MFYRFYCGVAVLIIAIRSSRVMPCLVDGAGTPHRSSDPSFLRRHGSHLPVHISVWLVIDRVATISAEQNLYIRARMRN